MQLTEQQISDLKKLVAEKEKYIKPQFIRLLDVFIVGPTTIRAARKEKNKFLSDGLLLVGFLTIAYNGYNFIKNEQLKKLVEEILSEKL